jgi:hypothetical protein
MFAMSYNTENVEMFPTFNLTEIGLSLCCLDEGAECLGLSLDEVVTESLIEQMEVVQKITPKMVIYHTIILLTLSILHIIPTWLSNYFDRVAFNRYVERERRKMELNKLNINMMDQLCLLLPPSVVSVMTLRDKNDGEPRPHTCNPAKPLLTESSFPARTAFAELYEGITILFVDMVGFTKFSAQLDPDELVMFLNHMYSKFDIVLERYSLYKVEIIGDALFAVAGCPNELKDPYGRERKSARARAQEQERKSAGARARARAKRAQRRCCCFGPELSFFCDALAMTSS